MLSTRAVLGLLYVLLCGIVLVHSVPNRILMRFGKRTMDPVNFRAIVPAEYYPVELLGTSHFVDGDM
ncbi:hypothetical protein Q1695_001154 [Nippostrongylus brasiliensis]|nr:hypothetical protein Q1695_001154 [Nippostrongylus brasiliensis]